jgi:hypothetical protein
VNSKDESISFKPDHELFEYMLENAEIEFETGSDNGITSYYELENGIKIHFGDDGELTGFELPEDR